MFRRFLSLRQIGEPRIAANRSVVNPLRHRTNRGVIVAARASRPGAEKYGSSRRGGCTPNERDVLARHQSNVPDTPKPCKDRLDSRE